MPRSTVARSPHQPQKPDKHAEDKERICKQFPWRKAPHETPRFLVAGPPQTGKSTVIKEIIGFLDYDDNNRLEKEKVQDEPCDTIRVTSAAGSIKFTEVTVKDGGEAKDVLAGGQGRSPPCFVILVWPAQWKDCSAPGNRGCNRESMEQLCHYVSDEGLPSCLLLTKTDRIGLDPQKATTSSKAQLKGVDTLNFDPTRHRRVFLVPDRPKSGSLTTHDWPLRAMHAMAVDSSQRVKDNSPHHDTPEAGSHCGPMSGSESGTSATGSSAGPWSSSERQGSESYEAGTAPQPASPRFQSYMSGQGASNAPSVSATDPQGAWAQNVTKGTKPKSQPKRTPMPSQTSGNPRPSFNIREPDTWFCWDKTGKLRRECTFCDTFMANVADSHKLLFRIDCEMEQLKDKSEGGKKRQTKVPQEAVDQFLAMVNGLINTLEGGCICIHFKDGRLNDKFSDQISYKLSNLVPVGSVEDQTYNKTTSEKHIIFHVSPAQKDGRCLSTFDAGFELSRDVGTYAPNQIQILTTMKNIHSKSTEHLYESMPDPEFDYEKVLPDHFRENKCQQMKAIWEKDIDSKSGETRAERFTTWAMELIKPYLNAFAIQEKGGIIYLGLDEEKKTHLPKGGETSGQSSTTHSYTQGVCPRPSGESSCRPAHDSDEKGTYKTGRFICKGTNLTQTERDCFKQKLRCEVERMKYPPKARRPPQDLVMVEFPPVKERGQFSKTLCIVKIIVKHYHGILWFEREGPLAFKVVGSGRQSDIVQIPFEDWISAFDNTD